MKHRTTRHNLKQHSRHDNNAARPTKAVFPETIAINICPWRLYIYGGETGIGALIDMGFNKLVTSLLLLLWRNCLMAR
jgi:hypothetical protein